MSPKPSKGSGGGEQLDGRIDDLEQRVTTLEQSNDGESEGGGGEHPRNRVWDSSGRTHGELTGTNDAAVVGDAIADRAPGARIVIPDPGFTLGWDRQVDLPVEDRFGVQTVGTPTIRPSAGFSGDYALYKPSGQARDQYLGSVYISDNEGVLAEGVHLTDVRGAMLDRVKVYNAPGIRIVAEDIYSNQNLLHQCENRYPGEWRETRNPGTGIVLETGDSGKTTDQNWIFVPHYNASKDFTADDVAYIDRGKHNQWLFTRCEFADTVHRQEGDQNYYISEGGWDRIGTHSVVEEGSARLCGFIDRLHGENYDSLKLQSLNTQVRATGTPNQQSGIRVAPTDLLDGVKRMTTARSLPSLGFEDASAGGRVSATRTHQIKPFLEWETGPEAGNTAVLSTGARSLKPQAYPKVAYSFVPYGAGDATDVRVRTGLFQNADNYFELMFDPATRTEGWHLELAKNGSVVESVDTGIVPATDQELAFNLTGGDVDKWHAAIDQTHYEIRSPIGGLGQCEWRWSVETLADENKHWKLQDDRGMRFFKY